MELDTLAVVAAAFLFAAFVKGTTGLGFSTACLAILALAVGLKTALPLLIIPSLASNLLVMVEAGQFRASLRRFWPLLLATVPGVIGGLILLTWLDATGASVVLGVVLIVYGLFALKNPNLRLSPRTGQRLAAPAGLLTGTINGLTGSQVMPVLPYLLALDLERNLFVQTINCSFTLSSLVMALGLAQIGLLTTETSLVSALGVVPVFAGIKLGGLVRRRLSAELFRRFVLVLLVASGLGLIARAW